VIINIPYVQILPEIGRFNLATKCLERQFKVNMFVTFLCKFGYFLPKLLVTLQCQPKL